MHINIQIYVLMCLHQCIIVSMHTHVDNMHICVYVNTANTCPQSYTYKNIYFNFFHVCASATWGKCLQRSYPWSWSYRGLWVTQCRWWEPNSGPFQEQHTLLTAQPSLPPIPIKNKRIRASCLQYPNCMTLWNSPHISGPLSPHLLCEAAVAHCLPLQV